MKVSDLPAYLDSAVAPRECSNGFWLKKRGRRNQDEYTGILFRDSGVWRYIIHEQNGSPVCIKEREEAACWSRYDVVELRDSEGELVHLPEPKGLWDKDILLKGCDFGCQTTQVERFVDNLIKYVNERLS